MSSAPAAWTVPETDGEIQVALETDSFAGTDFPYGCRWCGRSTYRDTVEICEKLLGVVHSDCHEEQCTECAELLCTEDRCDFRDECDDCYEAVCKRHGLTECCC